jgi:hypothetical protein
MERTRWTERKFNFDIPEGWMINLIERLRGTTVRIKDLSAGMKDNEASIKACGDWSFKEHIGHLADLEDLHLGRLDDYHKMLATLRAADMDNKKTREGNHINKEINNLVDDFAKKRALLVERFATLDNSTQARFSLHPRLQVKIKPVDLAYFICEHDDHHLATMREINKVVKKM